MNQSKKSKIRKAFNEKTKIPAWVLFYDRKNVGQQEVWVRTVKEMCGGSSLDKIVLSHARKDVRNLIDDPEGWPWDDNDLLFCFKFPHQIHLAFGKMISELRKM